MILLPLFMRPVLLLMRRGLVHVVAEVAAYVAAARFAGLCFWLCLGGAVTLLLMRWGLCAPFTPRKANRCFGRDCPGKAKCGLGLIP